MSVLVTAPDPTDTTQVQRAAGPFTLTYEQTAGHKGQMGGRAKIAAYDGHQARTVPYVSRWPKSCGPRSIENRQE